MKPKLSTDTLVENFVEISNNQFDNEMSNVMLAADTQKADSYSLNNPLQQKRPSGKLNLK